MTKQLADLRDILRSTMNQLVDEGPVSNKQVIDEVKRKHGNFVRAASQDLSDIAMLRLLNSIAARRTKISALAGDRDLFGGIGGVPDLFSIQSGDGNIRRVKFGSVKLSQLISAYAVPPKRSDNERQTEFSERLKQLAEEVGTEEITFQEAVERLSGE